MGAHVKFSPSASDKWINCPGYINLLGKVTKLFGEEESSEAATEGTAAHEAAEKILKARNPTKALRDSDFDTDLKMALEYYIDMVEDILDEKHKAGLNPVLHVEKSMLLCEGLGGTADVVIEHDEGLVVVDYKHGQRVYVDPSSTQLKIYGYLAAMENGRQMSAGTIELFIVQPRYIEKGVPRVRSVGYSLEEFVPEMAQLLKEAMDKAKTGDEYNSGGHCLFCAAKPLCPKKQEVFVQTLEAGKDLEAAENLKFILDNAKEMQSIIKKAQSCAIRGLESGTLDPEVLGRGLKKRFANRSWTHAKGEEGLAPLLRRHGIDRDLIWVRKLISPAQAEKMIDDKKWLSRYTHRPETGVTLVALDKADPELVGSTVNELAEYVPEEPKAEQKETKEPITQKTNFDEEEF